MGYDIPPPEVMRIFDAPSAPLTSLSPDRTKLLQATYESHPPVSLLARPVLRLGGVRIDPGFGGHQRLVRFTALSVIDIASGKETRIDVPADGLGWAEWSPDSTKLAFSRMTDDDVELWVADAGLGRSERIDGVRLCDALFDPIFGQFGSGSPFVWSRDSNRILALSHPSDRSFQIAEEAEIAPRVDVTEGKSSQMGTFQDLLKTPHDEDLFERFTTAVLLSVDLSTGSVSQIGEERIFTEVTESPDSSTLLVKYVERPFSFRVPFLYFSRKSEVWDQTGKRLALIASLPVSDEIPRHGVPLGPRQVGWVQNRDASLVWVEALDGGDPINKVPHRDAVMRLDHPFDGDPVEALRIDQRFSGWMWFAEKDRCAYTEWDRDRRWRTTYILDLANPDGQKKVLFDLSVNDDYNDPGWPVMAPSTDGRRVVLQDGSTIYLFGQGASEEGDRPFVDVFSLEDGSSQRLFESDPDRHQSPLGFLGDSRTRLVLRDQSPHHPPNITLFDVADGTTVKLTDLPDPHPELTPLRKESIRYLRDDGVELSGWLYLPPGRGRDERVPTLIWAYPMDYSDPETAGQVRGSGNTFTRLQAATPLWFLTQGFAVLMDATMPVVGDPETMNDTFIEQVTGSAKAAIDELDRRDVTDRARVIVGGHSYGAFMTANLLAHTDLFAAGIARSGAYNRSLTPFGFQTERRSYWEVPEIYEKVSPYRFANKITAPLLLIHGEADSNMGTHTIQSERMFQAIQGTGGTARLVLLPHESHGYRARESVLHVISEMLGWGARYAASTSLIPELEGVDKQR